MINQFLSHCWANTISIFDYCGKEFSESMPTTLAQLQNLGYQVILTGKLSHFYGVGYPTNFDRVALPLALVPVTAVITFPVMLIQKNKNEGFVELSDIQLVEIATGKLLWSGSFSKRIERYYYDSLPNRVANEALKEIVTKMVDEISRIRF